MIADLNKPKKPIKGKGKCITVFPLDKVKELRGQVISKLFEGCLKLCAVDRTGVVPVEVFEDTLPVLDVFPEPRELRRKHKRQGGGSLKGLGRTSLNPMVPLRSVSNIDIRSLTVSRSKAVRSLSERSVQIQTNWEPHDSSLH